MTNTHDGRLQTMTGRFPRPPEIQDLHWGRARRQAAKGSPFASQDFASLEIRVLAAMAPAKPA